ncbi:Tetratricopeptide repeat domain 27 [Blomia tropicalis]|nr:Tetratricopeptide repeat domain 27 [Blomia tropicalis]
MRQWYAVGFVAAAAGFYYYRRNATTPSAILKEAASDVKKGINTVAGASGMVVDTAAAGVGTVADTAVSSVASVVKSVLSKIFDKANAQSSDDDNFLQILNSIQFEDLSSSIIRQLLIQSAICSLQLYVVDNFLCFIETNDEFKDCLQFVEKLSTNPNINSFNLNIVRSSVLLRFSRYILKSLVNSENDSLDLFHCLVWSTRCCIVHQMSLKMKSDLLFDEYMRYVNQIVPYIEEDKSQFTRQFKLNIVLEIINSILFYGDTELAKKYFSMAQQLSHLEMNFIGRLGKRTMYQEKPVSQLMVKINKKRFESTDQEEEIFKVNLPKYEKLEDDTLLQDVKFEISDDGLDDDVQVRLNESEQCFLMTTIEYTYRMGASNDNLLRDQLSASISFLLERTTVWSIAFALLEKRSYFERSSRRRIERSMKQLETLTNTVRTEYDKKFLVNEVRGRIRHFYSILSSPFWHVEKLLADLLVSLGVVKSALDVYLRLELWNEVVGCYRQLKRPDKAEEIVRNLLERDGDNQPNLHCILGEITGDIECYHHALKLTNQKYAPATKMLGMHYFALREFDKALDYYQQSVATNSSQPDLWFRIGYIGLIEENWELAANAYRQVLQFEENSFEAWNNLSKAYIKLGDKPRAMRTLQEAIKCNFENWKIWDNYIAVAIDVGAFNEAIEAWNRLIDFKNGNVDDNIITILVEAVVGNILDCDGEPSGRCLPKLLKLFGRVTATSDGSAIFWRKYARLMIHNREKESSRITQCLQKCHRKMIANEKCDLEYYSKLVKHLIELVDEYMKVTELDPNNQKEILNGCKLTLNSMMVKINRAKEDLALVKCNEGRMEPFDESVRLLEEKFSTIKQMLIVD